MRKIVVTSVIEQNKGNAGSKAKNDDRKILISDGFVPMDIVVPQSRIKKLLFAELKLKNKIKTNVADEYIIQYPLYSMLIIQKMVSAIRKCHKNAKIIILIHDVESLRLRKGDFKYSQKERKLFNEVDALIVHNDAMSNYLRNLGIQTPMASQGVFDYMNNQEIIKNDNYEKKVCFAGNLEKAAFLKNLELVSSRCNVYGLPKPQEKYKNGVVYKGAFPADELPKYLDGDFGLIWDGLSLDTNDGVFGEYTKYNSPHKTSLYLSCGIPVIVWKEAGIARFIQKNNLGLIVENIDNLDEVLNKISDSEYKQMKKNAENYAYKIRKGENVLRALNECENLLSN